MSGRTDRLFSVNKHEICFNGCLLYSGVGRMTTFQRAYFKLLFTCKKCAIEEIFMKFKG